MPADHFQSQDCRWLFGIVFHATVQLACCDTCCCCCTLPHCCVLLVLQPSVTTSWRQAHPQLLPCRPRCLLLWGLAVCCWAQPLTLVLTRPRCCGGSGRRCWRWQRAARTHGSSHSYCQGGLTERDAAFYGKPEPLSNRQLTVPYEIQLGPAAAESIGVWEGRGPWQR